MGQLQIEAVVYKKLMLPRKKLLLSKMLNVICQNGRKDKNHRPIKVAVEVEAGDAVIVAVEEAEIEEVIRDRIVEGMIQDPNMDRRIQIYKAENIIIQEMFVYRISNHLHQRRIEVFIHV